MGGVLDASNTQPIGALVPCTLGPRVSSWGGRAPCCLPTRCRTRGIMGQAGVQVASWGTRGIMGQSGAVLPRYTLLVLWLIISR